MLVRMFKWVKDRLRKKPEPIDVNGPGTSKAKVWYCYLAAFLASLSSFTFGLHVGWTSPSKSRLLCEWNELNLNEEKFYYLTFIFFGGAILGSLTVGHAIYACGSKRTILFIIPINILAWLNIFSAKSYTTLLSGRFMAGYVMGISFAAVPTYIAEISDKEHKGVLMSRNNAMSVFGMLVVNIVGYFYSIEITSLFGIAVSVLQLCTFIFFTESPYYYLSRTNQTKAIAALQTLRRVKNVEKELLECTETLSENRKVSTFSEFFTRTENRLAIFVVYSLGTFKQLSGLSVFQLYARTIFEFIVPKDQYLCPVKSTVIFLGLQLFVCYFSSFIVERFNRKPLLVISFFGSGVSLVFIGLYSYVLSAYPKWIDEVNVVVNVSSLPFVAMCCYLVFYGAGMCNVPTLVLNELFDTRMRPRAFSMNDIYYSILSCVVTEIFMSTNQYFGMYAVFLTFSFFCFCGALFVVLFVPETRNKSLAYVQEKLSRKMCLGVV